MKYGILKWKKNELFDILSLFYVFILGAFSGYVENKKIWGIVLKKDMLKILLWLLTFIMVISLNILNTGKLEGAVSNLTQLSGGLAIVMLLSLMCCYEKNIVYRLLIKLHWFIELFGLFNLVVLTCQINIIPICVLVCLVLMPRMS